MLRYKEIKMQLMDVISSLKPLERLPSRPYLCKQLETTRTTLDKAIKELEQEGVLVSRNGSGTYIVAALGSEKILPGSWGIIVPSVMRDTYPKLVHGVETVTQHLGVNLILCNSDDNMDKQQQYIHRLLLSDISGIIIVPAISSDMEAQTRLYNQLQQTSTPFVFCNRGVDGIDAPVITSNSFYGGYIATKHLIEQGYQRIAFLSHRKYRTSEERCYGYISALTEQGIDIHRGWVIMQEEENEKPFGYAGMKRLLESSAPVDAVFCFNDQVAVGAYQAIREAGRSVSDDIGVIGYDDAHVTTQLMPQLTSISYKSDEIGEMAAVLLNKLIHKETLSDFTQYLFQPEIVMRASCLGKRPNQ